MQTVNSPVAEHAAPVVSPRAVLFTPRPAGAVLRIRSVSSLGVPLTSPNKARQGRGLYLT
jgi:hypothetical protein